MQNSIHRLVEPDVASQLASALDRNATFLTPNTRLAAYLREVLDAIMLDRQMKDQSVWRTPEIIPFDAWTTSKWNEAMLAGKLAPKLILTAGQDALYWEQALDKSPIAQTLMSPSAAATQAQQGYQLLRQSLVDIDQHAFDFNSAVDSRAFFDWIKHYRSIVQGSQHISLVDAQSQLLSITTHTAGQRLVVLVGFESPTPLQQAIVDNYIGGQGDVEKINLSLNCQSIQFNGCRDFVEEVKSAAVWSKSLQNKNSDARIAVVIQNLSQNRMLVERNFLEAFEPNSAISTSPSLQSGFNISAGIPLSEASVIKVGLSVIDAISRPLALEQWVSLLNSPFIGDDQQDVILRRSLIAKAHDAGEKEYTLLQMSRLLSWRSAIGDAAVELESFDDKPSLSSGLLASAQFFISWQSGHGKKQSKRELPSHWLPVLRKILTFFIWPGSRTLNSDEYQQLTRFELQCESFASFDSVVGKVSLATASQLFRRHCQQQVFHRETVKDPDAPNHVQVLGSLEASGQTFDYLWLVGLSERQWPLMPQAHPLIPRSLQIDYAMPLSSVEREFEYAKRLTTSYLSSAIDIVVSYPVSVDDIASHISPLVDGIATELTEGSNVTLTHDVLAPKAEDNPELDSSDAIETIADHYGMPLEVCAEDQVLAGGSAMLKDYNVNPLKTYIKWRLGVRPLGETVLGVSALERGNAIHAALETVWQALGGSAALQDCTAEQISQLVNDAAESALNDIFARRFVPLSPRLRSLEKQRLQTTLVSWLKLEANRPGFIIDSLERALVFTIAGQTLQLRIDRIDRLEDGQLILIDYKSGATKPAGWLDADVTEPQLPLYVCAMNNDAEKASQPMAIAFARLKAGDLAYEGIASDESLALDIEGVKDLTAKRNHDHVDWSALAEHWQHRLTLAINEIASGKAVVDVSDRRAADSVYEPIMRLNCSDTCDQVSVKKTLHAANTEAGES